MKGLPVAYSQFVQRVLGELEVFVVPEGEFTDNLHDRIKAEVRKRVGDNIDIKVKPVEQVPYFKGGKRRAVVSFL